MQQLIFSTVKTLQHKMMRSDTVEELFASAANLEL